MSEQTHAVSLRLPLELYRRLKRTSLVEARTVPKLIERAIRAYLVGKDKQ
jgi:predicted DNA-binding protein